MTKYIISTGESIVEKLTITNNITTVTISTTNSPLFFNTIGEAMKAASIVNKLIKSNTFKVLPIKHE